MQELGDGIVAAQTPLDEAGRQIEAAGFIWRVTMLDGQPQPATKDYRPDRLDLEVVDGVVVAFTIG